MASLTQRWALRIAATAFAVGVCAAPGAAQPPAPAVTRTISGRIVDSLAHPVIGASVALTANGRATRTDSSGAFTLADVPVGYHTVTVRHPGFQPDTEIVMLANGNAAIRTITLAPSAVVLPAVKTVTVGEFGKPARLDYTMRYDEFYRRRSQNSTSARFYTHEDLEAMKTADLPDMLRRVPFLTVRQGPGGTQLSFPGCGTNHILIKLDNQRVWPPDSLLRGSSGKAPTTGQYWYGAPSAPQVSGSAGDAFELIASLHLENVEAIEVYKDMASLPADAIGEICGAIYIWTR